MIPVVDLGGKRWRYLSGVKEYKGYKECPVVQAGVKAVTGRSAPWAEMPIDHAVI
jgi:hypothetical protein